MSEFYKYHGLGNDYIVIDPNKINFIPTESNVKLICDRNYGIGADGILYGPIDNNMSFRIFNPDGSEAEKSGNGIRIFALYVRDAQYCEDDAFDMRINDAKVSVNILDSSNNIKVCMGQYSFLSKSIPSRFDYDEAINVTLNIEGEDYIVSCVNIGNPHCVLLNKDFTKEEIKILGRKIEKNFMFPNNINVQFVKVIDKKNIQIQIWERGAGYTLSSGSSACASTCVSYKLGLVDNSVNVFMPGGNVKVDVSGDFVYLTGKVFRVACGYFFDEFKHLLWK